VTIGQAVAGVYVLHCLTGRWSRGAGKGSHVVPGRCLFDDQVVVRLGKQDLNTEFLVTDLAGDYIQSSFGLSPSAGFPSYPAPSSAKWMLTGVNILAGVIAAFLQAPLDN
jgi:hypothetical protein